jgi:hypothetical protein
MKSRRCLIIIPLLPVLASFLVSSCKLAEGSQPPDGKTSRDTFLLRSNSQLGDPPPGWATDELALVWQTDSPNAGWPVEYRRDADASWRGTEAPRVRRIAAPTIAQHWLHQAVLNGLKPVTTFTCRARKGGNIVFSAEGRALRKAG